MRELTGGGMAENKQLIAFAYGSNMLTNRLRRRAPSATPIGAGHLQGHALKWHKRSVDGSGKCDIACTGRMTDVVWGVVFAMSLSDKPRLDHAEGLSLGYDEKQVQIHLADGTVEAQVYYAILKDAALKPFDWYKAFVIGGAREHGLPEAYIASLEAVISIPDPDERRAADNAAILASKRTELDR